jgi:hypothetical protein
MGNADFAVLSNVNFDGFLEGAHVILMLVCGQSLGDRVQPGTAVINRRPEAGNAFACGELIWVWEDDADDGICRDWGIGKSGGWGGEALSNQLIRHGHPKLVDQALAVRLGV